MTKEFLNDIDCLAIRGELNRVEEILAGAIDATCVPLVKEAARHIITSGGKRLRPVLAILSSKICGSSSDLACHLGAAVELIHTASIIHDDVLDNADIRRGASSTNAKWGNHLSILIGDYCLSYANKILCSQMNTKIISIIADAAVKTAEGEVLEAVHSSDLSITEENYMNIIKLKTAHLIAATCEAGSMTAESSQRLSDALRVYGMKAGTAFQIVDDILDYTIESGELGKKKGTDLKEGKLTLPVIYALKRATNGEKKLIKESLIAPAYSEEQLASVIEILNKYNCISDTKKIADRYISEAIDSLELFKPSIEKDALIKFTDFISTRRS